MLEVLNPINQYLYTKIEEKDPILLELEAYAQQHKVPIVTKEVAEYLKMMLQLKKCHHALEIGTAIGYSGIYIAKEISGTLTTIEIDKNRFEEAKKNFEKAKIFNVNQILGDATEEIKHLDETFDFIFIDASKGQYQKFFEDSYPKLQQGGVVFIDNILFRGYVCEEKYPKRYKTLVKKLDEFISYLYKNHNFVLLPFGDGIGIVWKKSTDFIKEENKGKK